MANLLQQGAQWLARQLREHASEEVHYRRGQNVLQTRAIIGRTEFQVDDGHGGVRIEHSDRDFLILREDLYLEGQWTEPQPGDQIEEFTEQDHLIYEVMAPTGQPVWRYDDPFREVIRVHTKLVQRE
jgi:hypothetical protein